MKSKSKLDKMKVRRYSVLFDRIQKEQALEFSIGCKVKLTNYKFLGFENQKTAETLKDEEETRTLRYEKQLHTNIFETNPQVTLIQFLSSGEEGIVVGVSLIDPTWAGEFCSLQYTSTEEAEAEIRKIGTVIISIGLANEKGTILEGRNITLDVSPSQLEKIK